MKMKVGIILFSLLLCSSFFAEVRAYSVSGKQLLGPDGNPILLRGIDRPSLEWAVAGQYLNQNDYSLMKGWGANIVRLSLNQVYWLNSQSGVDASGYKATVDQQVTWIKNLGMGVILDLHWSDMGTAGSAGDQRCMADSNSITFWTQVATKYKNDPWIIFELYNEPHDVSWTVWKSGGSSSGSGCPNTFTVAGMQQLYNAVRNTGANNVVIVNGLNYAYDLSGISSYALTGSNIVYGTHPYDYGGKQKGDWPSGFGYLTSTYPIIATEFGQYCNSGTYVQDFLNYANDNGIHWTAWGWFVKDCTFPSLISNYNGDPLGDVGNWIKTALGGGSVSGSTSSSGGTGESPPATSNLVVYTDALASNWQDWGWATRNLAATAYTHSGSKSISFDPSSNGAIYQHTTSSFDVTSYQSLQFWLNGGSSSGQNLKVLLYDSSANPIGQQATVSAAQQDTWTLQTVQISSFQVSAGTKISGFAIQGTGGTQQTVYVDDISFIAPDGSTSTTGKAATTSTTSTAKGSTTTSTTGKGTTSTTTAKGTTSTTAKGTTSTTAKGTTSTTAKGTTSTTAKSTTTTGVGTSVAKTISVTVNTGTNGWWVGINGPVSGGYDTVSNFQILQNGQYVSFTTESWGWTYQSPTQLSSSISVRITTTNNFAAEFTLSLAPATYSISVVYNPL